MLDVYCRKNIIFGQFVKTTYGIGLSYVPHENINQRPLWMVFIDCYNLQLLFCSIKYVFRKINFLISNDNFINILFPNALLEIILTLKHYHDYNCLLNSNTYTNVNFI